ncbi:hypothetical protein L195_g010408 [Trifolium pratense]|uniref:TF-B3 domain-containing protein n=1 Tax=Trifolium pratense TaxID=57577 RepID=A0A2K3PEM2_TRIPR|nr:hypothetical protein L195_g010408 [Trifolium pratense]
MHQPYYWMEFKNMNLLKSLNMLVMMKMLKTLNKLINNQSFLKLLHILMKISLNLQFLNEEINDESLYKWELIVSKAYASRTKSQVLHFPPKTAEFVLMDNEYLFIDTPHKLSGIRCTIKTYERKDKRKKNIVEKYLTKGWYNWVLANKLNEGDKLIFELERGSNILHVDIVRFNNYKEFMT